MNRKKDRSKIMKIVIMDGAEQEKAFILVEALTPSPSPKNRRGERSPTPHMIAYLTAYLTGEKGEIGQQFSVLDLDGVVVMSPGESKVDTLVNQLRDDLLSEGATRETILTELRQSRKLG